jgi:hypothetical protein
VLHQDVAIAEQNGAGAPVGLTEAAAKVSQILVGVHDVAFDGLHAGLVVPAIVERDPEALELCRSTDLGPGHPTCHPVILGSADALRR